MILGDLIKQYRKQNGCSMDVFAQRSGLSKAYISILERNVNPVNGKPVIPSLETIKAVSQTIGIDFNDVIAMLDEDQEVSLSSESAVPPGFMPLPKMKKVPLIGSIACGDPITAIENREGEIDVPEDIRCDFALRCKGNSMIGAGIHDGDAVYIRIQPEVENGQIAAVRIGDEATLKRVYLHKDYIELRPENPDYESIIRCREEMNDVHIEGKAVGYTHWFG